MDARRTSYGGRGGRWSHHDGRRNESSFRGRVHHGYGQDHDFSKREDHRDWHRDRGRDRDSDEPSSRRRIDDYDDRGRHHRRGCDSHRQGDSDDDDRRSARPQPARLVHLSNLPPEMTSDELSTELLSRGISNLNSVRVVPKRCIAFVEFENLEDAERFVDGGEDGPGRLCLSKDRVLHIEYSRKPLGARGNDDWKCPLCNTSNFAFREECFTCRRRLDYRPHTLRVSGLPLNVDPDDIRYTLAPIAAVSDVRILFDPVTQMATGFALVDFSNNRDAEEVLDKTKDGIQIGGTLVNLEWAPDVGNRAQSEAQMQQGHQASPLATAQGQGVMHGFFVVPENGLHFNPQTGVYFDPRSQLFFNTQTQVYYRFDSVKQAYEQVDQSGRPLQMQNSEEPTLDLAQNNDPANDEVSAQPLLSSASTAEPSKDTGITLPTASCAPVARSFKKKPKAVQSGGVIKFALKVGKTTEELMQRWKQRQEEDEPVEDEEGSAPDATPAIVPKVTVIKPKAADAGSSRRSGVRERVYISREKLACLLCQRQFKSVEKLDKHELLSEMHKTNLKMPDYDLVKQLEKSAKLLGIDAATKLPTKKKSKRSKKRSMMASRDEAPEPVASDLLNESNVGNKLLKAMGWIQGAGLGKDGTGRVSPVMVERGVDRAGLGSIGRDPSIAILPDDDEAAVRAKRMRLRFSEAKPSALELH